MMHQPNSCNSFNKCASVEMTRVNCSHQVDMVFDVLPFLIYLFLEYGGCSFPLKPELEGPSHGWLSAHHRATWILITFQFIK